MDRTAEFKAAVNSLVNRGHIQTRHQPNYSNHPARRGKEAAAYADFSRLATAIGNEITETSTKLDKLTKRKYQQEKNDPQSSLTTLPLYSFATLVPWTYSNQLLVSNNVHDYIVVKRKALFDDRPVEISVWKTPPRNASHQQFRHYSVVLSSLLTPLFPLFFFSAPAGTDICHQARPIPTQRTNPRSPTTCPRQCRQSQPLDSTNGRALVQPGHYPAVETGQHKYGFQGSIGNQDRGTNRERTHNNGSMMGRRQETNHDSDITFSSQIERPSDKEETGSPAAIEPGPNRSNWIRTRARARTGTVSKGTNSIAGVTSVKHIIATQKHYQIAYRTRTHHPDTFSASQPIQPQQQYTPEWPIIALHATPIASTITPTAIFKWLLGYRPVQRQQCSQEKGRKVGRVSWAIRGRQ